MIKLLNSNNMIAREHAWSCCTFPSWYCDSSFQQWSLLLRPFLTLASTSMVPSGSSNTFRDRVQHIQMSWIIMFPFNKNTSFILCLKGVWERQTETDSKNHVGLQCQMGGVDVLCCVFFPNERFCCWVSLALPSWHSVINEEVALLCRKGRVILGNLGS